MTLQTSGAISILDLRTEFGGAAPDSLSEYYAGGGLVPAGTTGTSGVIPTSGLISLNLFYGSSNIIPTGYFAGGLNAPDATAVVNSINTLLFSNETTSLLSATLAIARETMAGVNSGTKGYFAGGRYSFVNERDEVVNVIEGGIDGIIFTNNTSFDPAAMLVTARERLAGLNSSSKGYFAGGFAPGLNTSEIDGIIFSNDTAFNPAGNLPAGRSSAASLNSTNKGYIAGGFSSATRSNAIVAFTFSTEVAINITAVISSAKDQLAGMNSSTKGYCAGGAVVINNPTNNIDAFTFSTETNTSIAATLVLARNRLTGVNSTTRGYYGGGSNGGTFYNEIDGLLFSNETTINPAAGLLPVREHLVGVNSSAL